MGRREENQQQKRERIIAAAKALFSKHGHEGVSTRDIAKRARIAHGTLFLYVKTRADVIAMVWHAEMDAAVTTSKATVPSHLSFVDHCLFFYGAFIDVYARDPALAKVLAKELPWLEGPSRGEMMAVTYDALAAIAARVVVDRDAGVVRGDVDPMVCAQASFSLYMGALFAWLSGEVGDVHSDGRTTALALLREGLILLEKGMKS